ncbi:UDP-glucose 6-dehydrogenase [Marinococcus halophilus]|uniref:UDP-glucose 6-dehydrogenase n=1 Tax=Marinococcus halophilus TaxID=1371 RepID=A0A510Y7G4_MARHA|nr:UDP-glucose/GDP-mannose dehydrogenase family protein [Marinococcus halophilus]OZT79754.1 UDP-glucose 6-dehydrogenase [Marinococcus halophilus]GEK59113.1 UDP-glucose 6-dehydrogenase TuaD [Marinococcus halophilus]
MKLTVVGTGYVGLVSGTSFAELGNDVICVDKIPEKVDRLNNGEIPIYEPGLKELVDANRAAGRLQFTTELQPAVRASDIVIIAVGTPESETGAANMSYVYGVADEIGEAVNDDKFRVVVNKSTVPVGTADRVRSLIADKNPDAKIEVCSVPEFLREGSAVKDTFNPDRVIIGTNSDKAAEILTELHQPLTDNIVVTDPRSSEMIKYSSNAFLATKISFVNEVANICDYYGADINAVTRGMGMDNRIGPKFLNAGIGYGGSCFPKDVKAIKHLAEVKGYYPQLLQAVNDVNEKQSLRMVDHLNVIFNEDIRNITVALLGLAFKPNTDDMREAPSLKIIRSLQEYGVKVRAFDPVAEDNARQLLEGDVYYAENALDACEGADAAMLVTEWEECLQVTPEKLKSIMKKPVMIDGRNAFKAKEFKEAGFIYHGIGRK